MELSTKHAEWLDEQGYDKTFSGKFRVLWVSAGTSDELVIRANTIRGESGYLHARFPVKGDMWLICDASGATRRMDENLREVFT